MGLATSSDKMLIQLNPSNLHSRVIPIAPFPSTLINFKILDKAKRARCLTTTPPQWQTTLPRAPQSPKSSSISSKINSRTKSFLIQAPANTCHHSQSVALSPSLNSRRILLIRSTSSLFYSRIRVGSRTSSRNQRLPTRKLVKVVVLWRRLSLIRRIATSPAVELWLAE
jgi:hypothetical protein